jgi:hypothetical protein
LADRATTNAELWVSYNSAQRTQRAAIRFQTSLFSGLGVNSDIISHSAACRKNCSDGVIGTFLAARIKGNSGTQPEYWTLRPVCEKASPQELVPGTSSFLAGPGTYGVKTGVMPSPATKQIGRRVLAGAALACSACPSDRARRRRESINSIAATR